MKYLFFLLFGIAAGNAWGQSSPSKRPLRPYDAVITADAEAWRGLFTVYKVRDSFFLEIPDTLLGRDLMVINRYVQKSYEPPSALPLFKRKYPGEETDMLGSGAKTVFFAWGRDSAINVCFDNQDLQAESGSRLAAAVEQAGTSAILLVLPLVATESGRRSFVVDATSFLKSPTATGLAAPEPGDRYHVEYVHAYPLNVEIGCYKQDAKGRVNVVNASFIALPRAPMQQRQFDRRVGFFANKASYFADSQQEVEQREFIDRWRLEPRPEDRERWQRGELVEPAKPIVYYIDPHTPKQWVKYLILGINDWQKAFEQAGFKNAIMGKEWPYGDSVSLDDARYSFICYLPSETMNAYGPQIHDPRSGEIIQTHIGWYHNVMTLVDYWYRSQVGATDPSARHARFDDELMGQLIRFVSSHEVGHTLGLRHNFGSSSQTPVEKMRDREWLKVHGHTASIMDYARFNYVAQPEDGIPQDCLWPHINEYDRWAIQWGYTYTGLPAEEDKKVLSRMATDSLAANPRLWFGSQEAEESSNSDPRCQTEDLGDNNMVANTYGIMNLKRIIPSLPAWTKEEGGLYDNLGNAYKSLLDQYKRYVGHVMTNLAGVERTWRCEDAAGYVYAPVSKAQQQQALAFLDEQLFTTPLWLLDPAVTKKVAGPRIMDEIGELQRSTLRKLLDPDMPDKLLAVKKNYGDSLSYPLDEYFSNLHRCIWRGLAAGKPMDIYRRSLQRSYITALGQLIIRRDPGIRETDAWVAAQTDLDRVDRDVRSALSRYASGADKEHVQTLLLLIQRIRDRIK